MTVVGAAVILGLVVVALLRLRAVRPVAAVACVLFGLVLGASPVGGTVNSVLAAVGGWVAHLVGRL